MITIAIALCHAFRTNTRFSPELLYIGALIADVQIMEAVFK